MSNKIAKAVGYLLGMTFRVALFVACVYWSIGIIKYLNGGLL